MSEDVRRLVGRNVQQLRIKAGLSQAALAERMGVDRAYVSGLELGQRNPTIVTLWHISEALGVTLRSFFKEAKPRRPWSGRQHGTGREVTDFRVLSGQSAQETAEIARWKRICTWPTK